MAPVTSYLAKGFLLLAGVQSAVAQADASTASLSKCTNPSTRVEWRHLSKSQQLNYLSAVKCLQSKPAQGSKYYPVKSHFDDFAAVHINATGPLSTLPMQLLVGPGIHFNGIFFPWHRYLLHLYEQALQTECGYVGAHPFWDWSLDNPENGGAQFNCSPIFDPVYGFGGNGVNGSVTDPPGPTAGIGDPLGSCIANGPFANYKITLDPGPPANGIVTASEAGRCLKRNFFTALADQTFQWTKQIEPLLAQPNFLNFTYYIDHNVTATGGLFGVHGGGHISVGGEMYNTWSSINDPIFFMHHANIDRMWYLWQKSGPSTRLVDVAAYTYPNQTGALTNLNTVLDMGQFLAPSLPVKSVVDTLNTNGQGILCYNYESYPQH